jgi:biotin synthase
MTMPDAATSPRSAASRWHELASRVLDDHRLTPDEGLAILQSDDSELLDLLAAAYRVRHRWHGNRVDLNFLINAKSGLCGEDCGYCSQSRVSKAVIPRYHLVTAAEVLDGARMAAQQNARTYCAVISGRSPTDQELDTLSQVIPEVKAAYGLRVCFSVGLLSLGQARRLKAAGVDRINHNLNTSARFYPQICTTHSYKERLATLEAVRAAGLEICSGGIVGMGEEDADVVELALRLGQLQAEAVPVNFLIPIPGIAVLERSGNSVEKSGECPDLRTDTNMTVSRRLNPRYCLKVLALFRLANPRCELRIAGGREQHLGPLQALGLYAANSIFVGGYLTTPGRPPEEDRRMIEALGFTIGGSIGENG